jgi:methyl-accepting chemotaxis protein PixJ
MNFDKSPQAPASMRIAAAQLAQITPTIPNRLLSFLQRHLFGTIIISTCLNLGLTGLATWSVWSTSEHLAVTIAKQDRKQNLSNRLTYLDEVLTMSAHMFASTGNPMWEKRYQDHAPSIDNILAELTKDAPSSSGQVDAANKKLLGFEATAFKLAKQAKLKEASALLLSPEYQQYKQIYSVGVATTIATINTMAGSEVQSNRQALADAILLEFISLGLLLATGTLLSLTVRKYILDREQSQKSIQTVQFGLIELNEQLQQEDLVRSVQQDRFARESATLQADIGHILDVVNLLEDGNLTVEADVNERATGLIADTLNRLIESLNQIISVVVFSAERVVGSAVGLKELAVETANQAQSQTRSIQQIELSISEINSLSENSYQQALATTAAVQLAQAAVSNGQQEMSAMADGIESLQQGTEQIVGRVQNLNEFVELAAQFSKDRKRVAALSRVLALNASLLSTRALKEQDPLQFTSLAHEFKTIAERVNELAEDNNISLAVLEHRTNQIQTVTSGLNQDIADINQLVQKFTNEMGKSRQAFTNIQLVTDRVAIVGEQVSTSSQDIIRVVSDTLTAIGSIRIVAQSTEHKATVIRAQLKVIGDLARNLLQRVEFFQLRDRTPAMVDNFLADDDPSVVKNPEAALDLLPSHA